MILVYWGTSVWYNFYWKKGKSIIHLINCFCLHVTHISYDHHQNCEVQFVGTLVMKKKSISWKKIRDMNIVLGHILFVLRKKIKTKMEPALFILYVRFIVCCFSWEIWKKWRSFRSMCELCTIPCLFTYSRRQQQILAGFFFPNCKCSKFKGSWKSFKRD